MNAFHGRDHNPAFVQRGRQYDTGNHGGDFVAEGNRMPMFDLAVWLRFNFESGNGN